MTRSAAETAALAARAAWGAGMHRGQAGLFGQAVVRHLAQGRDPAELAAALAPGAGAMARVESQVLALSCSPDRHHHFPRDTAQPGLQLSALECVSGWHIEPGPEIVTARPDPARPSKPLPARVAPPEDLARLMNRLAGRTYVPETERSRVAGAGAGDIDND